MMTDVSARFALPHILPGQAQKEIFHNEALALIDGLLHPLVQSRGDDVPPGSPADGQCWIVGNAPTGEWSGEADNLALRTVGGWSFVAPTERLTVWVLDDAVKAYWDGSSWVVESAIADVSGGTTVDSEARSAITDILAVLRSHGLVAS